MFYLSLSPSPLGAAGRCGVCGGCGRDGRSRGCRRSGHGCTGRLVRRAPSRGAGTAGAGNGAGKGGGPTLRERSQVRRAERRGEAPALGGRSETAAPPAVPGAASCRCRPALPCRGAAGSRGGVGTAGGGLRTAVTRGARGPEAAGREPVGVSAQRRAEGAAPPPARPRPWGTRCSARGRRCATR